jgi:arylformamidase
MQIVDLSHVLEPDMPSYPGLPEPRFEVFLSHEQRVRHASLAAGTTFQIAVYHIGGNTGTYVDAPFHRHPKGADISDVPLQRLANLPGLLLEGPQDGPIGEEHFARFDVRGKAVLVKTGWSKHWGQDYFRSGPYVTKTASQHLAMQGAALVGIDCANIDDMNDPERPAHTVLLGAGIPIVEHLCDLAGLAGRRFRFFAVPPAIRGGTSFPVRAFALCESR